jgi:hypothetical protein
MTPPHSPRARAPSTAQQQTFIVENANILNRETKLAILAIVMMEIGPSVVMETGGTKEVDIDLDAVTAANEEVIAHIYNIVLTRRKALGQPAGAPAAPLDAYRPGGGPMAAQEDLPMLY